MDPKQAVVLMAMSADAVEVELAKVGAVVQRIANPRYRLVSATSRTGINAFVRASVYTSGTPALPDPNVLFYTLFPDGNGDQPQLTDGAGTAQFNGSPGWAFSGLGQGPIRIGLAEGASKDFEADPKQIALVNPFSDVVRFGDWRGEHTKLYLQFVEIGVVPDPTPTPAPTLDYEALARALDAAGAGLYAAAAVVRAAKG